jgi:hypothetical protein
MPYSSYVAIQIAATTGFAVATFPVGRPFIYRILFLSVLSLVATSACAGDYKTPSNRALQPGDPNYPTINSSPAQIVQFTATVPEGLSAEFHLIYNVEVQQDQASPNKFTSPSGCGWTRQTPFYIDLPLSLEKSGDTYTGRFSPDYFLPSACKWHLYAMTSPIVRPAVIFYVHSLYTNSRPLPTVDLTTNAIHIWCTRNGKEQPRQSSAPSERIDCVDLPMISMFIDLPPGLFASVSPNQRKWDHNMTQYLRSLAVEFHDLDVLIPAYLQSHQTTGSKTF